MEILSSWRRSRVKEEEEFHCMLLYAAVRYPSPISHTKWQWFFMIKTLQNIRSFSKDTEKIFKKQKLLVKIEKYRILLENTKKKKRGEMVGRLWKCNFMMIKHRNKKIPGQHYIEMARVCFSHTHNIGTQKVVFFIMKNELAKIHKTPTFKDEWLNFSDIHKKKKFALHICLKIS